MQPDTSPIHTDAAATVTLEAKCPLCDERLAAKVIPDVVLGVPRLRLLASDGDQVRAEGRIEMLQTRVSLSIEHTCKASVPVLEASE